MKNLTSIAVLAVATLTFEACSSTRSASATNNRDTTTVIQAWRAGKAGDPIVNKRVGGVSPTGAVNGTSGNASGIQPAGTMGTANTTSGVADVTGQVNATAGDASGSGASDDSAGAIGVQQFITNAAISGMTEVQVSQMALKSAQSAAVKKYAAMMVKDHGGANAELKSLAVAKGISLPANSAAGTEGLGNATGKDFDEAYLRMMIQDHIKAIHLFEQGAKSADPQVKAYASKHLPTLEMHLKHVTTINKALHADKK
jgi:putative membrane protein